MSKKTLPDDFDELSHVAKVCTLMEWGVFDDDDGWIGIKEDAPDDVKEAYAKLLEEENEAAEEGCIMD